MRFIPHEMTNKIAYDLGKHDFPSFYQDVVWHVNKEPFPYVRFFNWDLGWGGPPLKEGESEEYDELDWESVKLHGRLDTDMFKTLEHKLWYVRGRLSSYSVTVTEDTIKIVYANSHNLRDFTAKCLTSIARDQCMMEYKNTPALGKCVVDYSKKYEIELSEGEGCSCPATPSLTLTATPCIIEYIIGDGKEPE